MTFPRLMLMAQHGATPLADPAWQAAAARHDIVIVNAWKGALWNGKTVRQIVTDLKRLNPEIKVGIYTIMEEAKNSPYPNDDMYNALTANDWWWRDANGNLVMIYEPGQTYATKGTAWAEWLAQRNFDMYFNPATLKPGETNPDIWYCDNVRPQAQGTTMPTADYQAMHKAHWNKIRSLTKMPIMGNAANDLSAYPRQLESSFNESMFGRSWSPINRSWDFMMAQYRGHMKNTAAPHLVGFQAVGNKADHDFFMYAFCSCLQDDGYFCFTDTAPDFYKMPAWFPEFNLRLGAPQGASVSLGNGKYQRVYERGLVTVDTVAKTGTIT